MVNTITFGGWYQRTTMHLSEVFQFLSEGTSKLDLEKDIKKLKEYFDTKYNPAINYLFSLGAPTPKILANIKDDHPIVIGEITSDYVNSAIQILRDIEGKTTSKNLRSIQLLASIGVITGILGYLNKEYFLPKISLNGFLYLVSLSAIAFLLDWFLSYRMKKKKYELMFIERSKDI